MAKICGVTQIDLISVLGILLKHSDEYLDRDHAAWNLVAIDTEISKVSEETNKVARHKTAPEDLQASEIRYRRLFESARDGILILDAASRKITDVNPFMMEFLGYSRDEFLGTELWEIGLFKDKGESQAAFRDLQEKGYIRYDDMPLQGIT